MNIAELNLASAIVDELTEEGLTTLNQLITYLDANGTFEVINGIGPVYDAAILSAIEETLETPKEDSPIPAKEPVLDVDSITPDEQEGGGEIDLTPKAPELPVEEEKPSESSVETELPVGKVKVQLIHASGHKSKPVSMFSSEVDEFWRMNRGQWRDYEVLNGE